MTYIYGKKIERNLEHSVAVAVACYTSQIHFKECTCVSPAGPDSLVNDPTTETPIPGRIESWTTEMLWQGERLP